MSGMTPSRHPLRQGLVRDERGQGVVEFALILPVLLLVLVGILEFGSIYSNVISMRQGVREAGRQGSVAKFGSTTSCGLIIDGTSPSDNIKMLMCLVKDQSGVQDNVKIRVGFTDANLNAYTEDSTGYVAGNAIVVCAAYPLTSLTGLFQPFLGGRVAKTKAAFRIEKADPAGATGGGERDPSDQNWAWCT
jgi:Flp pilus assembly pilin Flp